jgi:hypothetical protein
MTDLVHYFKSTEATQLATLLRTNAAVPYMLPSIKQDCNVQEEEKGLAFLEGFVRILQEVGLASVVRLDTLMLANGENVQQRFTRLIEQNVGEFGEVHRFLNLFLFPLICMCPKADTHFKCMFAAISTLCCDHNVMHPYWEYKHMHILYVQEEQGAYIRGDVQLLVDEYQRNNDLVFSVLNRYLLFQLSVPQHQIKLSPMLLLESGLDRTTRRYSLKGAIIYVSRMHFIFVQFDLDGMPDQVYDDANVRKAANVDEKNAVVLLYEFRGLA